MLSKLILLVLIAVFVNTAHSQAVTTKRGFLVTAYKYNSVNEDTIKCEVTASMFFIESEHKSVIKKLHQITHGSLTRKRKSKIIKRILDRRAVNFFIPKVSPLSYESRFLFPRGVHELIKHSDSTSPMLDRSVSLPFPEVFASSQVDVYELVTTGIEMKIAMINLSDIYHGVGKQMLSRDIDVYNLTKNTKGEVVGNDTTRITMQVRWNPTVKMDSLVSAYLELGGTIINRVRFKYGD